MLNTTQMEKKPKIKFGIKDRPESLSRTKQSFKDEADINNIMKKYLKTGIMGNPLTNRGPGFFGDYTGQVDYQTVQNKIIDINNSFIALPAKIRERFDNNPSKALDFLMDTKNTDEAIELGLLPPSLKKAKAPANGPDAAAGAPRAKVDPANPATQPVKADPAGQPAGQPAQP